MPMAPDFVATNQGVTSTFPCPYSQKEKFYTEGPPELQKAREAVAQWSLHRAAARNAASKRVRDEVDERKVGRWGSGGGWVQSSQNWWVHGEGCNSSFAPHGQPLTRNRDVLSQNP